jgi:hypothetical protein
LIGDEEYGQISEGDDIEIFGLHAALAESDGVGVRVRGKDLICEGRLDLSNQERNILLAGGRLNFHRRKLAGDHRQLLR